MLARGLERGNTLHILVPPGPDPAPGGLSIVSISELGRDSLREVKVGASEGLFERSQEGVGQLSTIWNILVQPCGDSHFDAQTGEGYIRPGVNIRNEEGKPVLVIR